MRPFASWLFACSGAKQLLPLQQPHAHLVHHEEYGVGGGGTCHCDPAPSVQAADALGLEDVVEDRGDRDLDSWGEVVRASLDFGLNDIHREREPPVAHSAQCPRRSEPCGMDILAGAALWRHQDAPQLVPPKPRCVAWNLACEGARMPIEERPHSALLERGQQTLPGVGVLDRGCVDGLHPALDELDGREDCCDAQPGERPAQQFLSEGQLLGVVVEEAPCKCV
mmetsp:Transcript_35406/g.83333  ORF Transcript_35406/g.83333 Transcript_35406/m.83333 type:complete len:224 (+) Transcript_35406:107-778(+)